MSVFGSAGSIIGATVFFIIALLLVACLIVRSPRTTTPILPVLRMQPEGALGLANLHVASHSTAALYGGTYCDESVKTMTLPRADSSSACAVVLRGEASCAARTRYLLWIAARSDGLRLIFQQLMAAEFVRTLWSGKRRGGGGGAGQEGRGKIEPKLAELMPAA